MAKVFICGHGGWQPSDGYCTVPKKSSVTVYTVLGKSMRSSDVNRLILGTYTGEPDGHFGAFKSCPDMVVYPDDAKYKASAIKDAATAGVQVIFTDEEDGQKLSEIMEENGPNEYHWACCRALMMNGHDKSDQYGTDVADTQSSDGYGDIIGGKWTVMHKF